ncbi:hypothetical protein [Halopelagius longus]|uniref:Uncharacterized protein n=1 Tax=Halopelagius longus TaxID=1236180 RepID=A0A1H1AC23_9EURY|nr:hypothetical protein [Halopelagius longus]RDI70323.1 hypothetical protein DWB78_00500 [Halopelagius longus]SDQ37222.1 hypothetical protein SAMN05216278_1265 [Halopelagius longus]
MSRGSSGDGYRRGRDVERERDDSTVSGRYRQVLPVIWGTGAAVILVLSFLNIGFGVVLRAIAGVFLVTHIFFAGLIRADIKSLRRQGVDWGHSRHLWFGAAFTLPFVALAYYWYSGRVVRRVNESRGVADAGDASDADNGRQDASDDPPARST